MGINLSIVVETNNNKELADYSKDVKKSFKLMNIVWIVLCIIIFVIIVTVGALFAHLFILIDKQNEKIQTFQASIISSPIATPTSTPTGNNLEQQISNLQTQITTLQNEVQTLQSSIISSPVSTPTPTVNNLEQQISNLQTQITTLQKQNTNFENEISKLKPNIFFQASVTAHLPLQTINIRVETILKFDTLILDTVNGFDWLNSQYRIPSKGYYLIITKVTFSPPGFNFQNEIWIALNGVRIDGGAFISPNVNTFITSSTTSFVGLFNVGDKIEVHSFNWQGNVQVWNDNVLGSNGTATKLTIICLFEA